MQVSQPENSQKLGPRRGGAFVLSPVRPLSRPGPTGLKSRTLVPLRKCRERLLTLDIQHYILRSRFAASRIQSANSCATGFRIRFFKVISASGLTVVAKSILSSWFFFGWELHNDTGHHCETTPARQPILCPSDNYVRVAYYILEVRTKFLGFVQPVPASVFGILANATCACRSRRPRDLFGRGFCRVLPHPRKRMLLLF